MNINVIWMFSPFLSCAETQESQKYTDPNNRRRCWDTFPMTIIVIPLVSNTKSVSSYRRYHVGLILAWLVVMYSSHPIRVVLSNGGQQNSLLNNQL